MESKSEPQLVSPHSWDGWGDPAEGWAELMRRGDLGVMVRAAGGGGGGAGKPASGSLGPVGRPGQHSPRASVLGSAQWVFSSHRADEEQSPGIS